MIVLLTVNMNLKKNVLKTKLKIPNIQISNQIKFDQR